MLISTRGRYALRVMIDIAENPKDGEFIAMKEVAARQTISLKYLEHILPTLVKGNLLEGMHGKGGGYRLTREAKDYTLYEILQLTEGDLAPVSCLQCGSEPCEKRAECRTVEMWQGLNDMVSDYFKGITIADLIKK